MSAIVRPKIGLPYRADGWKKVRAPEGISIKAKVGARPEVTIDGPEAIVAALSHALETRTNPSRGARPLYEEMTTAVDDAADVKLVADTLEKLRAPKSKARLAGPITPAAKRQLEAAFVSKFGHGVPASLAAFLAQCDGIEGDGIRAFGSSRAMLAGAEEDWSAICFCDDGDGPGILVHATGHLVVDVFHETPGNEHGEGWPVLGRSFGKWLAHFAKSKFDPVKQLYRGAPVTPAPLDWTDAAIAAFVRRVQPTTSSGPKLDARTLAFTALAAKRHAEVIEHASVMRQRPHEWARATFMIASALHELGRGGEARRELDDLAKRWLDDAVVPPPGMHPRLVVDRGELKELATHILGAADAKSFAQRVDAAGELSLGDGDFL